MSETDTTQPDGDRLRTHPEERFAVSSKTFDLDKATADLANEPVAAPRGHRQKTLYRHKQASLALFLFEAGAGLREHQANATVFIQVLEGRLVVHAEGERNELSAGQVLVLAPNVRHDVQAEEKSRMLLTICLESPDQAGSRA